MKTIIVFLFASVLFVSMFAFAIAQETENETNGKLKEIGRNFSNEIKGNWSEIKDIVKQGIKDQRMNFTSCISDSAKLKNDCLNSVNEKYASCKIEALNVSNMTVLKQCNSDFKNEKAECMRGFKETKTECNKAKHSFFDSIKAMFQ